MMGFVCAQCHSNIQRKKDTKGKHYFCSQECYRLWKKDNPNKTTFKKGRTPWNKGTVGVMKANSGSFAAGHNLNEQYEIGSQTTRLQDGRVPRVWVKIANNGTAYDWMLKAIFVWEQAFGKLPAGMVVHHKDKVSTNDVLENLELISRAEHIEKHRDDLKRVVA